MRRAVFPAGVLAVVAGVPGIAGADPSVSAVNIRESVRTIGTDAYVYTIDTGSSSQPLETVDTDGNRVTMRISADLLFDFNAFTLTAAARKRISQLAPQLKKATGVIEVSGHTDSIGDPSYNLTLSQKRAEAVKAEMERVLGGDKSIKAEGFGESKPIVPNQRGGRDDPAGRAKNRRVEIVFTRA